MPFYVTCIRVDAHASKISLENKTEIVCKIKTTEIKSPPPRTWEEKNNIKVVLQKDNENPMDGVSKQQTSFKENSKTPKKLAEISWT